jgi:hypothetical protein
MRPVTHSTFAADEGALVDGMNGMDQDDSGCGEAT